jgi:membrane protease subunit HflK
MSNPQVRNALHRLRPVTVVLIIAAVIVLWFVFSSYYLVDQKEVAVLLTLGKYTRMVGPGLHFKMPFGIQKNYNVPTQRILKEEFGFRTLQSGIVSTYSAADYPQESTMLTGDLNIVDVEWIIQYQIVDAKAWLFNVQDVEKTIRDISQSVINQLVGDRTIFDVIGSERANIEAQGLELMNELYTKYGLGIRVTAVQLQNIVPPKGQVQDAFEDVNKAIQDRSRLINEGKEAYNQAIPRARGEAEKVVQQAEGYATQRVNEARGDVARFLAVLGEYRQAPEVVRARLYYEMYSDVFGADGTATDLVDKNLTNFLPIKNLGVAGAVSRAAAGAAGGEP